MKERVTLTLESSIIKKIDSLVDKKKIRNRSHAVELLVQNALSQISPTTAVILAGGTEKNIDNCLKTINGKPIIASKIEFLEKAGVSNIIIVTSDINKLKTHLKKYEEKIRFIKETHSLGTAGSLKLCEPYLKESFIVTNGDDLAEVDIANMYKYHKELGGWCTIALSTVKDPSKYGVALLNGNRIVTFVEKPSEKNAPSNLISAGTYIMEKEVIRLIPEGYAKMEEDIFPKLVKEDKLYGFLFSGKYIN